MAQKPIFDFPVAKPTLLRLVDRTFTFSDGTTIMAKSNQEEADLIRLIQIENGGHKPPGYQ